MVKVHDPTIGLLIRATNLPMDISEYPITSFLTYTGIEWLGSQALINAEDIRWWRTVVTGHSIYFKG